MPRIKWLKCHRCGRLFDPWNAEVDEYGYKYCSEQCWRETQDERGQSEKADRDYEDYWFAVNFGA